MSYPRPKWLPELLVNIDSIVTKVAAFTENKKTFVIFTNGTCVFPSLIGNGMEEHCFDILRQVVHNRPNFDVSRMVDGSYLVSFSGPVYSLVLHDEYENNRDQIIKAVDEGGLLPSENISPKGDFQTPLDHYYIGLFARARLYRDVAETSIAGYMNLPEYI